MTTAIASYLQARQAGGEWLVRIEDIDPPREVRGAAESILAVLEALALEWDRTVLYQSTRFAHYEQAAVELLERGRAFRCSCSRREVRKASTDGRYPGTCRNGPTGDGPTSIRVRVDDAVVRFEDDLQGTIRRAVDESEGDYVVFRRDQLPAYHLAVVLDDAHQGVTHVVRGVDLLESTPAHIHLQGILGLPSPDYAHVPVVTNRTGQKLSKQTGATGIDPSAAAESAFEALGLLGMEPPHELRGIPPSALWDWALTDWDIARLSGKRALHGE